MNYKKCISACIFVYCDVRKNLEFLGFLGCYVLKCVFVFGVKLGVEIEHLG